MLCTDTRTQPRPPRRGAERPQSDRWRHSPSGCSPTRVPSQLSALARGGRRRDGRSGGAAAGPRSPAPRPVTAAPSGTGQPARSGAGHSSAVLKLRAFLGSVCRITHKQSHSSGGVHQRLDRCWNRFSRCREIPTPSLAVPLSALKGQDMFQQRGGASFRERCGSFPWSIDLPSC